MPEKRRGVGGRATMTRTETSSAHPDPSFGLLPDRVAHRDDFLLLLVDDLLCDTTDLLVVAVAQDRPGHVYRGLVVRDHHVDEIPVDVARGPDLHRRHHLRHGGLVLRKEKLLVGSCGKGGGGHGREGEQRAGRGESGKGCGIHGFSAPGKNTVWWTGEWGKGAHFKLPAPLRPPARPSGVRRACGPPPRRTSARAAGRGKSRPASRRSRRCRSRSGSPIPRRPRWLAEGRRGGTPGRSSGLGASESSRPRPRPRGRSGPPRAARARISR